MQNATTSIYRAARCFISIDIVGSTAFKMKHIRGNWAELFQQLLEDAVQYVTSYNQDTPPSTERPKIHFWRMDGDEVLFYSDKLINSEQVNSVFQIVDKSVKSIDEKYIADSLGAKGTIWLAGFPSRNKEFLVSSQSPYIRFILGPFDNPTTYFRGSPFERTDERLDFLGPEIDLGFRLAAFTSPRRVVVSFDAAYHIARSGRQHIEPVRYYHVGWHVLKGLYSELPYPIFWLEALPPHKQPKSRTAHEEATSAVAARFFDPAAERSATEVVRLYSRYCLESGGALTEFYIEEKDMPEEHRERWLGVKI